MRVGNKRAFQNMLFKDRQLTFKSKRVPDNPEVVRISLPKDIEVEEGKLLVCVQV